MPDVNVLRRHPLAAFRASPAEIRAFLHHRVVAEAAAVGLALAANLRAHPADLPVDARVPRHRLGGRLADGRTVEHQRDVLGVSVFTTFLETMGHGRVAGRGTVMTVVNALGDLGIEPLRVRHSFLGEKGATRSAARFMPRKIQAAAADGQRGHSPRAPLVSERSHEEVYDDRPLRVSVLQRRRLSLRHLSCTNGTIGVHATPIVLLVRRRATRALIRGNTIKPFVGSD